MIASTPNESPRATWPPFAGPLARIPRNRQEVVEVFGDPRLKDRRGKPTPQPDPAWVERNIVEIHGAKMFPGVPPKWFFQCHRLAEPYLREAFRRAQIACPEYQIERAGGFVFRHIRHDPKRALSMHAYGIAVDVDPARNQAVEFPAGKGPAAWSETWRGIWPKGLPPAFVDAFLSVGFTWGGDWNGDGRSEDHRFIDPQHWELTNPLLPVVG